MAGAGFYVKNQMLCVWTAGTRPIGENDDLVAWDTQATVPLPDIHAKARA